MSDLYECAGDEDAGWGHHAECYEYETDDGDVVLVLSMGEYGCKVSYCPFCGCQAADTEGEA